MISYINDEGQLDTGENGPIIFNHAETRWRYTKQGVGKAALDGHENYYAKDDYGFYSNGWGRFK